MTMEHRQPQIFCGYEKSILLLLFIVFYFCIERNQEEKRRKTRREEAYAILINLKEQENGWHFRFKHYARTVQKVFIIYIHNCTVLLFYFHTRRRTHTQTANLNTNSIIILFGRQQQKRCKRVRTNTLRTISFSVFAQFSR